MNNQEPLQQQHGTSLVDRFLDCIDTKTSSKEKFLELTDDFRQLPETKDDQPFMESMAILDFLAQQIQSGNSDIITQKIIQESCLYILPKLLPHDNVLPESIRQRMT